ncbi:DUF2177 family protein [Pelomonas sp. KK5]|uniref:DUF2177 family protein n=1 Tax=Pelomonas sp. KK5 TaxID=1855730 RepID=UPI00097BEAA4|nr:DUF2177 family protein [Pelomonas sp. KK5]
MTTRKTTLAVAYAAALLAYLLLDAAWLGLTASRLYRPAMQALMAPEVDWLPVLLFYPLYTIGLVVFAIAPALRAGRAGAAFELGALLGLLAYGCYDLTNQATLRDWPWTITVVDMAWGAIVGGGASAAGAWAALRLTSRPSRRTGGR